MDIWFTEGGLEFKAPFLSKDHLKERLIISFFFSNKGQGLLGLRHYKKHKKKKKNAVKTLCTWQKYFL